MRKHAYKLELTKRLRTHDVFHVSLLEHDHIKKGLAAEKMSQVEFEKKADGEEYEVEAIQDSAVY